MKAPAIIHSTGVMSSFSVRVTGNGFGAGGGVVEPATDQGADHGGAEHEGPENEPWNVDTHRAIQHFLAPSAPT